jgi:hypothetical protein
MLKLKLILTLLIVAFQTTAVAAQSVKHYSISGVHSKYGPYQGQLTIEGSKVERKIQYATFRFEDLQVEELWSGALSSQSFNYSISTDGYVSVLNSVPRPSPQIFKLEVPINDAFTRGAIFEISGQGVYAEKYSPIDFNQPFSFWNSDRKKIKIEEKDQPFIYDMAFFIAINRVVEWFQSHPDLEKYPRRANYYDKAHFAIYDSTDFEFYKNNKESIRVANAPTNDFSLTESYLRRSAFAFSANEKALKFEQEMDRYHLDENGLLRITHVDAKGNITHQDADGDGALWSGMYAGTLAMKYLSTGAPEVLTQFKRSLQGMFLLMDITGDPSTFARNIRKPFANEAPSESWRQGSGRHSHLFWLHKGNNDMFKGLVHTLAWAYHILPENDPMRGELNEHALKISNLEVAGHASNKTYALGLATLATHRADLRDDYIKNFARLNKAGQLIGIEGGFYTKGISDWSGINLNLVSTITNILIAEAISKRFPSGELSRWEKLRGKKTEQFVLNQTRENLMDHWAQYAMAKRDFVTLAAYAFAYRFGTRGFDYDGSQGKEAAERNWKVRSLWDESFAKIPRLFREMPIERARFDLTIDHSIRSDFSISSSPRLPWKSVKEKQTIEYHVQGSEIYPWFELHGNSSNFAWKDSAFAFKTQTSKQQKLPGVDFLFSYWMAKWAGL